MFKVYGDMISGNCYKLKLLLTQLDKPFEWIHVDIMKGETRTPEFLAKNPNGKIPVLEYKPGKYLSESNAILYFLSGATEFFPSDLIEKAQVQQWLCFEQYSHEPYIAVARFWIRFAGKADEFKDDIAEKQKKGYKALDIMEKHLSGNDYFVGDRYTIADVALYAYTHVAHEGNFDLSSYGAILTWLDRVKSQPNHVTMTG